MTALYRHSAGPKHVVSENEKQTPHSHQEGKKQLVRLFEPGRLVCLCNEPSAKQNPRIHSCDRCRDGAVVLLGCFAGPWCVCVRSLRSEVRRIDAGCRGLSFAILQVFRSCCVCDGRVFCFFGVFTFFPEFAGAPPALPRGRGILPEHPPNRGHTEGSPLPPTFCGAREF